MSEPKRYALNLSYAKDGDIDGVLMVPHSTGLYVEWPDYHALRKHAEALVKALDNIGVTTDEDDILWTANHAINEFREAYPKEINHASGGDI